MLIALLTDFGTRDPYVASMKGVIAGRCDATIIDLSHEIAPFDVFEAAFFLDAVMPYFPGARAGAVIESLFIAVVDPGVGTSRKIVAADLGGQLVLAPDNGLLTLVLERDPRLHSVENEQLFLPGGSATFHGRDRFAPVAAAIAGGLAAGAVGPPIGSDQLVRFDYSRPIYGSTAHGTIVAIDRFGNAVTDLEVSRCPDLSRSIAVIGDRRIEAFAGSYIEGPGGPFMIAGSRGTVEISLEQRSAADVLHIERGQRVEIRPR